MDKENLTNLIKRGKVSAQGSRISLLYPNKKDDEIKLNNLISKNKDIKITDELDSWIKEVFLINFPSLKNNRNFHDTEEFKNFCLENNLSNKEKALSGIWVLFGWSNQLVHILNERLHHQIITTRNKNLINQEEQSNFYNTKIGIAGLSVGQSAALTIATTGGARYMKLADYDRLEGSNLNRIRATISEVNDYKCDIIARQIYSINPFSKLELFYDGINDSNLDKFTENLDIIVDEIDNFHIKALLRKRAKEKKIPLIMAFDSADGVVLDVERYDITSNQKPFFGNISETNFNILLKGSPDPRRIPKLVAETMGENNIPDLFKSSIIKVGSELTGVPQLGSTAFLAGCAVAFASRVISSGNKINGRFKLDLRDLTSTTYDYKLSEAEHSIFKKIIS